VKECDERKSAVNVRNTLKIGVYLDVKRHSRSRFVENFVLTFFSSFLPSWCRLLVVLFAQTVIRNRSFCPRHTSLHTLPTLQLDGYLFYREAMVW
jgi:hypothetical protein